MPIKKEELDEVMERKSILDYMEPGMFYSIFELSELMLRARTRFTDSAYVQAIVAVRIIRGELIEGHKNGRPYYCRKT